MRVLFLTKYHTKGASSRYRALQYLPYLQAQGVSCEVHPLFDNGYLQIRYQTGRVSLVKTLFAFVSRLVTILRAKHYDVIYIEAEALPYFSALPERILNWKKLPYVVDYDDAIFHNYDAHSRTLVRRLLAGKIAKVMAQSAMVSAGNDYLASYAAQAGAQRIEQLPTVIDLEKYPSAPLSRNDSSPSSIRIGWIGSPSTAKYLKTIAPALAQVCAKWRAELVLVGSGAIELEGVPTQIIEWSEREEVAAIQSFDIGIMPLVDSPWERGKCGFKLVQYMACSLPVVASPVGVNQQIVQPENGFLAKDEQQWVQALGRLIESASLRQSMGEQGRQLVEQKYCLQVTAPKMLQMLRTAAKTSTTAKSKG